VLSALRRDQQARPGWGSRRRLQLASADGSGVGGLRRRRRLWVGGALASCGAAAGLCWPDSGPSGLDLGWLGFGRGVVRPAACGREEGGALLLVCARQGCLTRARRA
jgi:hypothetical protein